MLAFCFQYLTFRLKHIETPILQGINVYNNQFVFDYVFEKPFKGYLNICLVNILGNIRFPSATHATMRHVDLSSWSSFSSKIEQDVFPSRIEQ